VRRHAGGNASYCEIWGVEVVVVWLSSFIPATGRLRLGFWM
jgi:hypothetical protein